MEITNTGSEGAVKEVKSYENQAGLREDPHMSDGKGNRSYFQEAYGDKGFTSELMAQQSQQIRIAAEGPAKDLFEHIGSGYAKLIPERVKNASFLKDDGKEKLIKTAGQAWQVRKEATEEDGTPKVYFFLRDDIDL